MNVETWNARIQADFPVALNLTVVEYLNRDIDDDANIQTISGKFWVEEIEGETNLFAEDEFSDKMFVLYNVETYEELPDVGKVKRRVVTNDVGRRYVLTSNVSDEHIRRIERARTDALPEPE